MPEPAMNAKSTARTPEREQFEQWAHGKRLTTMPNGDVYAHVESQMAWEAWQAGRGGLLEALRELLNAIKGIDENSISQEQFEDVVEKTKALLGTEKERKS